jgi:hypothetical protein
MQRGMAQKWCRGRPGLEALGCQIAIVTPVNIAVRRRFGGHVSPLDSDWSASKAG